MSGCIQNRYLWGPVGDERVQGTSINRVSSNSVDVHVAPSVSFSDR